jgi:hypothetical protein
LHFNMLLGWGTTHNIKLGRPAGPNLMNRPEPLEWTQVELHNPDETISCLVRVVEGNLGLAPDVPSLDSTKWTSAHLLKGDASVCWRVLGFFILPITLTSLFNKWAYVKHAGRIFMKPRSLGILKTIAIH